METFTNTWNTLMAVGTLGLMALCLILIYSIIIPEDRFSKYVNTFASKYFLSIGFLVALASIIGSQVYEHVIGYPPCMLCWYARVAIYPLAVLFGIALVKKDSKILDYAMGLSVIGIAISGFHYIVETIGVTPFPCSAGGVSCLTRYVYEFGFITIPFMVLIAFIFTFLVLLAAKRTPKTSF